MMKRIISLLFLTIGFYATGAHAEDYNYIKPNWPDLLRTLVRLKGIDLQDQLLLDEYVIIEECDLYKAFYSDDFKWNKVRVALSEDATENASKYPIAYRFDTRLQLDRYDFQDKIYRFSSKATLDNINTAVFYEVTGPACGKADIKYLPRIFRVVFDSSVNILGLPLLPNDAEKLLKTMESDNNSSRIVYTRFKFHVVYIEPLLKSLQSKNSSDIVYTQATKSERREMRLDAILDAIDFYEDEAMTKLIYEYKP